MDINSSYNFEYLKNEAEDVVKEVLELELEQDNEICKCQDCVLDIVAFALNNIKPIYKTSLAGSLYAKSVRHTEYSEAAKEAVKYAIEVVKKNPSH
jgi:competence protein ComFB